jgi:hypothetical protein
MSVINIVLSSDEFWANSTLNVLRNLVSVNKELHTDLMGSSSKTKGDNKKAPIVDQALKVMIQRRPMAMNKWKLNIQQARYMFSLKVTTMTQHCVTLPQRDIFSMTEYTAKRVRENSSRHTSVYIRFIEAYHLAVNSPGGLKAAMRRRQDVDKKVLKVAEDAMDNYLDTLQSMGDCLMDAIEKFESDLAQLREGATTTKRLPGEAELHRKIRILQILYDDAGFANSRAHLLLESLSVKDIPEVIQRTREVKKTKESVFRRYRLHTGLCPELMKTDFLTQQTVQPSS